MTKRKNKQFIVVLIIFIVCVILFIFQLQQLNNHNLEVSFLNIGQGDSVLIETPDKQNILIDGGPDNKIITELGENLPWWDKTIDLIILTHAHSDHFTGLNYVLKRYNVKNVLYERNNNIQASGYKNFVNLIDKKNVNVISLKTNKIKLGDGCELDFFYPFKIFNSDKLNNRSIVTKLDCNNSDFLFTGDIEKEAEKSLIVNEDDNFLKSDVLQVAHHGSKTSSISYFLEKVLPKFAVIQCGVNNRFHHPHDIVLNRLKKYNIRILRNDINGTVHFIKNKNNKLICNYEKEK